MRNLGVIRGLKKAEHPELRLLYGCFVSISAASFPQTTASLRCRNRVVFPSDHSCSAVAGGSTVQIRWAMGRVGYSLASTAPRSDS